MKDGPAPLPCLTLHPPVPASAGGAWGGSVRTDEQANGQAVSGVAVPPQDVHETPEVSQTATEVSGLTPKTDECFKHLLKE